jgi:hypothetical protein
MRILRRTFSNNKNYKILSLFVIALGLTACSSSSTVTEEDLANAATSVQTFIAVAQSAKPSDIAQNVANNNKIAASGWIRNQAQVTLITQDLINLQTNLKNLPSSVLTGKNYPDNIKQNLTKLITDYFANMPTQKAANNIRFNINALSSDLATLGSKITTLPSLNDPKAQEFFCNLSIIARFAALSNQPIDTTTTETATAQINTALCL